MALAYLRFFRAISSKTPPRSRFPEDVVGFELQFIQSQMKKIDNGCADSGTSFFPTGRRPLAVLSTN
jgi:hypothetical protein